MFFLPRNQREQGPPNKQQKAGAALQPLPCQAMESMLDQWMPQAAFTPPEFPP